MGTITITTFDKKAEWTAQLSKNEFAEVKEKCQNSAKERAPVAGTLMPIRTNKNFAKDLFLPNLLSQAVRVEQVWGRVFAIFGALFCDIVTFPIRLITTVPRFISNATKGENRLHKYLREKKVDNRILDAESVKIRMEWKRKGKSSWSSSNERAHIEVRDDKCFEEKYFNFIEVPFYNMLTTSSGYEGGSSITIPKASGGVWKKLREGIFG